ncbi:MAG TPA: hypothetical protein VGH89_28105 [Pseudonocardia sp.]|jgi:hypothetical protein
MCGYPVDQYSEIAAGENTSYAWESVALGWLHMAEQRRRTATITAADIGSGIGSDIGTGTGLAVAPRPGLAPGAAPALTTTWTTEGS